MPAVRRADLLPISPDHTSYRLLTTDGSGSWRARGRVLGSFGPTTAGRMDRDVEQVEAAGGSLVMLAEGTRGQ